MWVVGVGYNVKVGLRTGEGKCMEMVVMELKEKTRRPSIYFLNL